MLRELFEEPVELEAEELEDEMAVRSALIRIQQLEVDEERVKATRTAVVESYDRKLQEIEEQRRWLRQMLQAWVERHGKTSFPDVGTAYSRRGDPAIEVTDRTAFKKALGDVFTKQTFDETAAKAYALERVLDHGELVDGTRLRPGGPTLGIRKAST